MSEPVPDGAYCDHAKMDVHCGGLDGTGCGHFECRGCGLYWDDGSGAFFDDEQEFEVSDV